MKQSKWLGGGTVVAVGIVLGAPEAAAQDAKSRSISEYQGREQERACAATLHVLSSLPQLKIEVRKHLQLSALYLWSDLRPIMSLSEPADPEGKLIIHEPRAREMMHGLSAEKTEQRQEAYEGYLADGDTCLALQRRRLQEEEDAERAYLEDEP